MATPTSFDADLFVESTEAYKCIICFDLPRFPSELACGHAGCKSCVDQWLTARTSCPTCKADATSADVKPSGFLANLIAGLTMNCPNRQLGCDKRTLVGKEGKRIDDHLAECAFQRLTCADCHAQDILRRDLPGHRADVCPRRLVTCGHCETQIEARGLAGHSNAGSMPCQGLAACPNGCHDQKDRSMPLVVKIADLSAHRAVCPGEPLACEICGTTLERRLMEGHLRDSALQHVDSLVRENKALKVRLAQQQPEYKSMMAAAPPLPMAAGSDAKTLMVIYVMSQGVRAMLVRVDVWTLTFLFV